MGRFKPENYVVEYEDGIYGIGVEPEAKITGFFEILSLLTSVLDDLDQYSGDPGEFPTHLKSSAYAAGGALQPDPKNPGKLIGDMAAEMNPVQFVEHVRDFKEFIPVAAISPIVIDVMMERARVLEARMRAKNVVRLNFKRKKVL